MFFDNPMYFFFYALAGLIVYMIMRRFGFGYAARYASLVVAVFLWWTAAGGPVGMWNQLYAFGHGVAVTVESLAPVDDPVAEVIEGGESSKDSSESAISEETAPSDGDQGSAENEGGDAK